MENLILEICVFDTIVIHDESALLIYIWNLQIAEEKFVSELAFALVAIARDIYQQEVNNRIDNGDIIQKLI